MAASHLIYSVPVLVDNLNKITDNVALTTHDNITNPTPVYVQTILFELLKEIGFTSTSIVAANSGRHNHRMSDAEAALLKEMMPVDNLMLASRYFFQKIGGCEITFGLLDLVDPKPIRIRKFLSSLVNFWLFCNNQYNATNEVMQGVKKLARDKNAVENRIREYRQRIVELRQSKAKEEMKAKKIQNDIGNLGEDLNKALMMADETKRKLEPIKFRLAELRGREDVLVKDIEALESLERRLKLLVRADEMKHNLELDLEKDMEEFEFKMIQQEGYQKRESQLVQQELDIKTFMEMLHAIASHLKKIDVLADDVKNKEADLESVRKSIAVKDERLMQVIKEAADLKGEMGSAKSKWNKKKICMTSELADYETKLSNIKQEMSEEDIISSELETSILKMKASIDNESHQMKGDIYRLKHMFHQVKSGIATFNMKVEEDMDMVQQAMEKLDKYLP